MKSTNSRCEASYRVAYHLGVAGKPFSDGELVKRCLIDVVKCIHPGKENDYSSIPLSRVTIQRRQDDIAKQLAFSLQTKVNKDATLFSLAVDESTDSKDSAHLLVFIRSLSPSFLLCEDLLSMETLSSRTRGEDILFAVKNACNRNRLNLRNLRGICTDGASAMTGSIQGFVARFSEYVSKEYNNKQLTNLHCIIHQEVLCVKSVTLNATLKQVNQIIIYIRANALHHRQFRQLLQLSETSAEDILYHTAVRWLSQGQTSLRVLQLRKEIVEYYSTKNKDCPLMNNYFLTSLAFLVDFLTLVNNLNQSLQGKGTTICFMYKKVLDFQDKCRLLKSHLQQENFFHFPQLKALIVGKEIKVEKIPIALFSDVFDTVMQDFADRFQDFGKISTILRLVAFPHLVDTESAPLNVQMELVELKNNEQLVKKFKDEENLVDIWKGALEYPLLRELARETLVLFGSTYVCEAAFSKMKYLKNEHRTRLLDGNLESELRLMVSSEIPDFAKLSACVRDQGSH